jgi:hypothetical protein
MRVGWKGKKELKSFALRGPTDELIWNVECVKRRTEILIQFATEEWDPTRA